MKKILFAWLVLLVAFATAFAQLPSTGAGKGSAGPSYTGSGDLISGNQAFWSCSFAVDAAYASALSNACDLVDASTGLTTYTLKFLATGRADFAGAAASSACATACVVKKMYNHRGTGDANQATLASMPPFLFNSIGTVATLNTNGSTNYSLDATLALGGAINPPWTGVFVGGMNNTTGSQIPWRDASTAFNLQWTGALWRILATVTLNSSSVGDTSPHVFQTVIATTSIISVDTTIDTGGAGTDIVGTTDIIRMGLQSAGSNVLNGKIGELGIWNIGFSNPAQLNSMNTNSHTRYGF